MAPRVDDTLDVTPPQQLDPIDAKDSSVDDGAGHIDTTPA